MLVGLKRTVKVQVAPGARVPVQPLLTTVKSGEPVNEALSEPDVEPPRLVTVKEEELDDPSATETKFWLGVATANAADGTPVPVRLITCANPPGVPVSVTTADLAPALVGEKCTRIMHLAPAERVPLQPLLTVVKSLEPLRATVSGPVGLVPVLVTVKEESALEEPTATEPKLCAVGEISRPELIRTAVCEARQLLFSCDSRTFCWSSAQARRK
jgi:hypothetical protein